MNCDVYALYDRHILNFTVEENPLKFIYFTYELFMYVISNQNSSLINGFKIKIPLQRISKILKVRILYTAKIKIVVIFMSPLVVRCSSVEERRSLTGGLSLACA